MRKPPHSHARFRHRSTRCCGAQDPHTEIEGRRRRDEAAGRAAPAERQRRKAGKPLDFTATPEELQILKEYACNDVTMMLDVIDRVGLLTPAEQAIWILDQQINERGVHMDLTLLETALLLEQAAKPRTARRSPS